MCQGCLVSRRDPCRFWLFEQLRNSRAHVLPPPSNHGIPAVRSAATAAASRWRLRPAAATAASVWPAPAVRPVPAASVAAVLWAARGGTPSAGPTWPGPIVGGHVQHEPRRRSAAHEPAPLRPAQQLHFISAPAARLPAVRALGTPGPAWPAASTIWWGILLATSRFGHLPPSTASWAATARLRPLWCRAGVCEPASIQLSPPCDSTRTRCSAQRT